ncbi:MAG: phosphotransferase [Pseudomonadota bacterium]
MFEDDYDRDAEREKFLKNAGYAHHDIARLKGDASKRIFSRLTKSGKSFILVDASPLLGEEPAAYAALTMYLLKNGLKCPQILAEDVYQGFFIVEDFGDNLFSQLLKNADKSTEEELYKAAIDVLVALQKSPIEDVVSYEDFSHKLQLFNIDRLIAEARLFTDWYIPELTRRPVSYAARDEFTAIFRGLLLPVVNEQKVVVLRDYHADNLMWFPDQKDIERVGLLDYQDAVIGNPAYDVVSLLQDARRPIASSLQKKMIDYYLSQSDLLSKEDFMRCYNILGAQRNIKILGIFMRLFVVDKKSDYLAFLPTVWGYLEEDLAQPELKPLKDWFDRWLPLPLRHEEIAA